jgi:hypothetical protein
VSDSKTTSKNGSQAASMSLMDLWKKYGIG